MDDSGRSVGLSSPVLFAAIAAFVLALNSLSCNAGERLETFHIDSGNATLTLNEFSTQSSIQVLFDFNVVSGLRTKPVDGEMLPSQALQKMLVGTHLKF